MSAIRSFALHRRRVVALGIVVLGAVLLAVGLVLEPPSQRSGGDRATTVGTSVGSSGSTEDAGSVVDPATGGAVAPVAGDLALDVATEGPTAPRERAAAAGGGVAADAAIAPDGEFIATEGAGAAQAGLAPPEIDARIIRTGSIELRVARRHFESAWGDAQVVARANGGYIVAASRSGAGDGPRAGTITMRVPTGRFDAAVDRLRDTDDAKVRRLDVVSQDVTQEFVDVRSRLRHDRAVEARLLALLAQTEGVSEVLAVQNRLDQVQEQIELSKGRLQYLEKMTAMSTIEVSITAPSVSGADRDDEERGTLGQSFDEAGERLVGNVAGAIVWIGGALPALVLLAIVAVTARMAWNRHRTPAATTRTDA